MIDYDHTPGSSIIGEKRDIHCQFGDHYYNKNSSPSNKLYVPRTMSSHHNVKKYTPMNKVLTSKPYQKKSGSKLSLQGTQKIDCNGYPRVHTVSRIHRLLRHIKLAHVQRCHYETVNINDGSQSKHLP